MKNCAIVLLFLVILMSSCNNKVKDPILSNFKSLHDAEYVFIDIDKENFGDPYGLIVIDSVLITLDVSDSYNLKIYNLKNG